MNRKALAVAGALLGVAGFAPAAHATLTGIASNIVVDGYTFHIQSCSGSACANLQWGADSSLLGVQFQESSGPILSASSSTAADVSFQFSVTGPSSTVPASITQVGVLVNGAVNGNTSTVTSGAFVSETLVQAPFSNVVEQQNLNAPESYYSLTPGFTSLDVSKDVHINAPGAGNTTTITAVYQDFVLVPEPATISIMLCGLTAAFVARRKRRAQ